MKQQILLIIGLCLSFKTWSQVEVVGYNYLNNTPLKNTQVIVKEGSAVIYTLDTKNESEFKIELDFGRVYHVYLQNEQCAVMYFEVIANTIPKSKYDYGMNHTFDVPFFYKTDVDVDTMVFNAPFYRIVYDGKKRMVQDTARTRTFDATIIKKKPKPSEESQQPENVAEIKPPDEPVVFAGRFFLNNDKLRPIRHKLIYALDSNGNIIKKTATNRLGEFAFTGIAPKDVAKIKMEVVDLSTLTQKQSAENTDLLNGNLGLYNSKTILLKFAKPENGICTWDLTSKATESLTNMNFSSNIGGKLVSSSPREKKFFANKTVYLSNKLNTVLCKTKTNMLGSFVFGDIKPDNIYYIGVDKSELKPGEKIDILNKDDAYIATLDSVVSGRTSLCIRTDYNHTFSKFTVAEDEMKMEIKANIFGDNINHPIGKLKIVLLNDNYVPIDSVITDNYGAFKFKYLPFLKRFYLSAENKDNVLDVFNNILIYSIDQTLIKVMTHEKGSKFTYKPVSAEISSMRDFELDDPWLEFIDKQEPNVSHRDPTGTTKSIIENILFEKNKYDISDQAKEILDKIVLVLNTNLELKIEIGAHTDSRGNNTQNMNLSELRAKTVRKYFLNAGIESTRISSKGYGESRLLNNCNDNSNCSEEQHALNRRIEFKVQEEQNY